MNRILEKRVLNKKKIVIVVLIFVLIILLISFIIYKKREEKWNNIDVSNAIHGVVINENVSFFRKPKISKWKKISDLKLGQLVYIVEEIIDKENNVWYKVKSGDKVGFIEKKNASYFEFLESDEKVLMSDVSKFNVIYKQFETVGEYCAFLLNYDVNYVYIRAGGRGYGEKGNFYTDPNFQMFIDACEYLNMPYGFYYIDEAITEEELDEEVKFIDEFLNKNKTKMCQLPLAIDVEDHDGVGRADEIWEDRAELVTNLIGKFEEKGIETIVYSNANIVNEYLYEIDTKFWIAYYNLEYKVPNYWYTETEQEAAQNEEFTSKIIGWQFTEKGIDKESKYKVDFSIVDNKFFKEYCKNNILEEK